MNKLKRGKLESDNEENIVEKKIRQKKRKK